jgi:hypothetical protein
MTPAQRAAFRLYASTPPERIHTHLRPVPAMRSNRRLARARWPAHWWGKRFGVPR